MTYLGVLTLLDTPLDVFELDTPLLEVPQLSSGFRDFKESVGFETIASLSA